MSSWFKSKSKPANPNALPSASRDIRSSEGPLPLAVATTGSGSQIPTLNGLSNSSSKPSSPTVAQTQAASVNNSLSSVTGSESSRPGTGSRQQQSQQSQQEERSAPSPEQKSMREPVLRGGSLEQAVGVARNRSQDEGQTTRNGSQEVARQRTPVMTGSPQMRSGSDASPYPWSTKTLNFTVAHTTPFPRYGAAVNATASRDGSIYIMGGLINGSTVKGDLWMVEAGAATLTCYPVATTSEGPGPRVGHASLLVGNAFIVFGGDTKMDEGDSLDDTLYLLNTSTKQWSRALPAGPRPPGRYGHTLNILGSKIYIFGGQVEGYFFNDLVAFDLNALQQATNRWEILIQNTIDGGPPHGQIPPARTNHTMISWGDKLYLFGGTDGVHWFNDCWSYSPHTNSWTQLECIGYIPSPREGHAAALVGDVMYIFGGRNEEGNDLGDLAAFRIATKRWYTFQNMGPSPSARSGHSMTTVGKTIVVLAGEPSSAPRNSMELANAYFLDTSKIRYPPAEGSAQPQSSADAARNPRRPSGDRNGGPLGGSLRGQQSPREMDRERTGSGSDLRSRAVEPARTDSGSSRLPQATTRPQQQLPAPSGPPPQPPAQQQQRTNGTPSSRQPTRPGALSPQMDAERGISSSPQLLTARAPNQQDRDLPSSPSFPPDRSYYDNEDQDQPRMFKPQTYQPSQDENAMRSASRTQREEASRQSNNTPEQASKARAVPEDGPQDSGIGSSPALTQQHDSLARELEQAKQKNDWYASELALARKSGYRTRSTVESPMDERAPDSIRDEDKPLIEALLKMKAELARVQDTIDEQSKNAAERIAEMEKQRDAAISEAVYAKTRLAGQGSPQLDSEGKRSPDQDRSHEMSKRLVSSLNAQTEQSRKIDNLIQEVEAERKARQIAEDTAEAAQKRVTELDLHRQQHGSEAEGLRSELYEAQRQARDASAAHADIKSQHDLLQVDKREVDGKLERALGSSDNHVTVLASLRDAVTASTDKSQALEQRLEEERSAREDLERKMGSLRSAHDERASELDSTTRRLRDAEALAAKHAQEADTHRTAVLAGLGKLNTREVDSSPAVDERVTILQKQVDSANELARQSQAAADAASDKLRQAEQRIAGLEAFQQQAAREGLSLRKQLQATLKENQSLSSTKHELEQKVQSQMLETNALAVQHASLRDVLGERGINASEVRRSRAMDSPSSFSRFSTPDLARVKELEQQLDASLKSHDEMKQQFEEVSERDEKMKKEYEDKLTALDNDHQVAVRYLRGTEKMLSKMKLELQRVKDENRDMKKKLDEVKEGGESSKRGTPDVPSDWETEREQLKKEVAETQAHLHSSVADLESRIEMMQQQLQSTEQELHDTKMAHTNSQADLTTLQTSHSQARTDFEKLQKDNSLLEERAKDAENKVQLLLDQVESSVDNYRRQSRMGEGVPTMNGTYARPLSNLSETTANNDTTAQHSRNLSDGGNSTASERSIGADGRNSLALDSLASELETLRSHWETTNRSYRISNNFEFERNQSAANPAEASATAPGPGNGDLSMANWRRGLDVSDDSPPPTSDGPGGLHDEGEGVATPTQGNH